MGDVPAVSNAPPRIGNSLESQRARPRGSTWGQAEKRGVGAPLDFFGSGGLGVRLERCAAAQELGCGGLCPHPPRLKTLWVFKSASQTADGSIQRIEARHRWNLRFLGFSCCCRVFGRNPVYSEYYPTTLNSLVRWFSVSAPVSVTATRSSTRTPKQPGR